MNWPFGLLQKKKQPKKPKQPDLTERLATSGTGWAAVINGVLDVRTVADTKNSSAYSAIIAFGYEIMTNCNDPDCDCKIEVLKKIEPSVRLVPVEIKATDRKEKT